MSSTGAGSSPTSAACLPVCAVVVTYQPDAELPSRLAPMVRQSGQLVIVDNGSDEPALSALRHWSFSSDKVELLELGDNLGLAAALNRGFDRAAELGFHTVISYDQDSLPAPGMVKELLRVMSEYGDRDRVAAVGPAIVDRNAPVESYRWLRANPAFPPLFQRVASNGEYRDDVTFIITSGALMPLAVFRAIGPFDEDLFIDYIDHEYCLRARAHGYRVLVSGRAQLLHSLGVKRELRIGRYTVRPTFHAADRLYYIFRNRIPLLKRYGLREFHWLAFDLVATGYNLLRVALFEDDRLRKLRAVIAGTTDGLLGRTGARRRRPGS